MRAAQQIAVELLAEALNVRVSTRKPSPHPDQFIVVSRIGGGNDDWCTRDPRFLVECFAHDELAAEMLAERAHEIWRVARTTEILWASADNNLAQYDDPDPGLFRFQFTGGLKLKLTA